jgi:hypothetical protein
MRLWAGSVLVFRLAGSGLNGPVELAPRWCVTISDGHDHDTLEIRDTLSGPIDRRTIVAGRSDTRCSFHLMSGILVTFLSKSLFDIMF